MVLGPVALSMKAPRHVLLGACKQDLDFALTELQGEKDTNENQAGSGQSLTPLCTHPAGQPKPQAGSAFRCGLDAIWRMH